MDFYPSSYKTTESGYWSSTVVEDGTKKANLLRISRSVNIITYSLGSAIRGLGYSVRLVADF